VRHYCVAVSLQIAVLILGATAAAGQELASNAGETPAEHVRHLRSRKALKPVLFTDEDKQDANDAAEPAAGKQGGSAPKTAAADSSKDSAPRPKKIVAKPAPAKPAPAKPRVAAPRSAPRATPGAVAAPAPASHGLLEEIFGDN